MCGIAVIFGQKASFQGSFLQQMLEVMAGRGEVTEISHHPQVVAGTRRLKIVDRDHAQQPLFNQARDRFIVFNGEIFNFLEIREKLEGKYQFQTHSDTETILHAFTEYGQDCVHLFEGQFAFAIVDLTQQSIFYARDRLGITPLYYVETEGLLYLASEIKALTPLNQKIYALQPGHFRVNKEAPCSYFNPAFTTYLHGVKEFIPQLKYTVNQAIQKRVATDLPIGIIYSGGLDSSIVLSQAVKFHSQVTAFTIGSKNSEDFAISQRFCQERKINQVVIDIRKNDLNLLDVKSTITTSELTEYGDIINAVISKELYRKIHQAGIKAVVGGDGSDELFGGYDMYALNISEEELHRLFIYKLMNLHRTELQRVDRCSMAFGIETRVPFLDHALVELALSIPREWKVNHGVEKWCLRQAFQDELPEYIINRKKNPLSHSSGLHEWVRLYKITFPGYYKSEKYYLHDSLKKDFSGVLEEQNYQVDRAIAAMQDSQDYSKRHLLGEFCKASIRKIFS